MKFSSSPMTSRERIGRMFEHREADHVPIVDYPWNTTWDRWVSEGLPRETDFNDYFGLDRVTMIPLDVSPRYPQRALEETDEHRLWINEWGVTVRDFKHSQTVPHYEAFTIQDWDSWREAKGRMVPSDDRIDWKTLESQYRRWRDRGDWIQCGLWFGTQAVNSAALGVEKFLMTLIEDPELVVDIFGHLVDMNLALAQRIWDAGYEFDSVLWPDDMGYKQKCFYSPKMFREHFKPLHRRAVEWAHARGIKAQLHSCGYIMPLLPDIVDMGVDSLHPLEVKAGMDPVEVKLQYGNQLVLHGGINALSYGDIETLEPHLRSLIPSMMRQGGYILATDHSIPDNVGLEDFRRIVALMREIGRYH